MVRLLLAVAVVAPLVIAACSTTDVPPRTVVRDSAGVTVAESSAPRWEAGQEWTIGEVLTRFETGDIDGVVGAVRLDDGTVVVADEGAARLAFYSPDGRAQRAIGRSGDGPGEFRLIESIGLAGDDGIWAYDFTLRRLTLLDGTGRIRGQTELTPPTPSALAVGRLANGAFVVVGQWRTGGGKPFVGRGRDSVAILRYDTGVLADTLAITAGREFIQRPEENGRSVMLRAVMAHSASATVWGESVVYGDQVGHVLHTVRPDGGGLRIIRWSGRALDVGAADAAAWIDSQVASVPQSEREMLRAILELGEPPRVRPAYGRLIADAPGNLWVGEYAQDGVDPLRWEVIDRTGAWSGTVRMPARFRPLNIGADWVLGASRDELGVEHVELRALRR